jgi:hydroxyethylthiazole kinase
VVKIGRALARELARHDPSVVRGNSAEMAHLGNAFGAGTIMVTTGPTDRLTGRDRTISVLNGHPMMAQVAGTGCLAGALIAAFLTVAPDATLGAAAALLTLGVSAEKAARNAGGPGSFGVLLLDALAEVAPADIQSLGRVDLASR